MQKLNKQLGVWCLAVLSLMGVLGACTKDNRGPVYPGNGITDIDGNFYNTLVIGSQEWMASNLKVVHYSDGSPIAGNLSNQEWMGNTSGAYAVFDHNHLEAQGINSPEEMKQIYGALYNFRAVTHPSGLCPMGWRVSTEQDWLQMTETVIRHYGQVNHDNLGEALKSCRIRSSNPQGDCLVSNHPYWMGNSGNQGVDLFGFSALPAGIRDDYGQYLFLGASARFWTSTISMHPEYMEPFEVNYYMHLHSAALLRSLIVNVEKSGFSVRCVRDI